MVVVLCAEHPCKKKAVCIPFLDAECKKMIVDHELVRKGEITWDCSAGSLAIMS